MIGKTISAKILESDEFKIAKAHSMGLEDASSIDERNPPSRLNKAFNDIGGEWDTLSRRFVSETHGQVYGLTGVAPPERIWAKTEIFEALKRAEVPMIEGIPRTTLTQVRDDLVTAGKYATPDDATFAVRAKVSMQADDNLRNSMVGVDADGKVKWIDTERLTNGALRNLPKPPELTYTLYAEHFDRKQAAALASDNPKTVQYALEKQAIQRTNPQVVAESIESLRTLPPTPTRQAAIDAMAHQGSTKGIYTAESASLKVTAADIANPQIQKLGGLPRTDLAAMSDELMSKHGYTQAKALEAVNARVTVQTALEEVRAGKPLVLTDELNRSYNTLSETERVLRHTPHGAELNKQVTAFTQATNGANDLVQHTLTAPATPMRQPLTAPNLKAEDLTQEVKTTKPNNHVTIQTNGVYAAEHKYSVEKLAQDQAKYEQAVKLQQELRNPATNMAAERKIVAETAHLGASIESGLSKVAGKALVGVGVIDAAVTISNDVEAAQRTANNRKEELTKGTVAFSKGVMQESGVDLAVSAVDAAYRLNPFSTIQRMVDNQTFNPVKGIGEEVQQNAQAREAAYTQFGETTGNSLYNTFSKEGSSKAEADKLTQAIPNITDPEARKTAETLRDAFAQTAHEEHLKNQNRIAGVHGVMNSYDDFIAKNPRYTDISKDDVVDETNKLTGNGMAAGQAVPTGYNNLKQQLDTENAERLAKLSPADREATLKVMERNPSASVRTASELVELANNRGMTTMGGAPIGENMYKAALAKMEEANYKADPTYGKDPRDIALQQQADKQRALEQAKQHIRDVVQTMSIDQKMTYYKAQAVEQHKDPNHYAHPHDAASTLVHLQYAKDYQERQAKRTQIDDYKESHGQTKSPTEQPAAHRPVAKPHEMGMGAHGANVKGVQTALNALGANIAVDGHYGKSTVEAAKAFQREHHLKIDGTIGVKDAKVMMNAIKREHIKNTQTMLNDLGADIKVNGHMDKATVAAVKEFQTEHQLKATGKLDAHTTDAISKAVHTQHEQTRTVEPVMTQTITTPPANQPDVNTPAAPAVSPEQSKQVEQMVSVLSTTNPTFAALAPDVQMTMAAQCHYQKAA